MKINKYKLKLAQFNKKGKALQKIICKNMVQIIKIL
jgi:hypothetical protein